MTISSETRKMPPYTGNGVTSSFAYSFRITDDDYLTVTQADEDGVETVLTLTTDYTVTGVGSYNGGNVVLNDPLPDGYTLVIESAVPYTQTTDIRNQGSFYPSVHEDRFDLLTRQAQQIYDLAESALRPKPTNPNVLDAKDRRIVNLTDGEEAQDATTLAQVEGLIEGATGAAAGAVPQVWSIAGDGATTSFPIAGADVASALFYDVNTDGSVQNPNSDFNISLSPNPFINFISAPGNGSTTTVILRGYAKGAASDAPQLRADLASTAFGFGGSLVGFMQAGANAIARTLVDKGREFVTPEDFSSGSDSVGIQRAIDAGHKNIKLKPGKTYTLTVGATIDNDVFIDARGAHLTSATDSINLLSATGKSGITIFGGKFTHTAAVRGDGVRFTTCTDCNVIAAEADGCLMGFRVTASAGFSERIRFAMCRSINSTESGFLFNLAKDCIWLLCHGNTNGTNSLHHGFYVSHSTSRGCAAVECHGTGNAGSGIQLSGQEQNIIGGRYNSNGTNGIVTSICSRSTAVGAQCNSNGGRGIYSDAADFMTYSGVVCRGNTLSGFEAKNSRYGSISGGNFSENVRHGIFLNGAVSGEAVREWSVVGPVCIDNDVNDTSTYDGIALAGSTGTCARNSIIGAVCRSSDGTTKQRYGISLDSGASSNTIADPQLFGNKTGDFIDSGSSNKIDINYAGSATWDPGNLIDGAGESVNITCTGAALGMSASFAAPYSLQGITATAYVSAANTVAIRLQNETGGAIDLASGTWRVWAKKG